MPKPELKHTDPPAQTGMRQALDRLVFRARYNWLTALLLPGGCWVCYATRLLLIALIVFALSTVI